MFTLDNQLWQVRPRLGWVGKKSETKAKSGPRNGEMGWVRRGTQAAADRTGRVWSSGQAQNEGSWGVR